MKGSSNPVRAAALIVVAITSAYVMLMGYWINQTLSGPGWCKTALGAEKASSTDGAIKGLDACVGLLTIQLKSLATNSHILFGVVALCLAVLIVIVIAGGKLSFKASKEGVETDIGRETPEAKGAKQVADKAVAEAEDIAQTGTINTGGEDG